MDVSAWAALAASSSAHRYGIDVIGVVSPPVTRGLKFLGFILQRVMAAADGREAILVRLVCPESSPVFERSRLTRSMGAKLGANDHRRGATSGNVQRF
jgi:hypothetical protein